MAIESPTTVDVKAQLQMLEAMLRIRAFETAAISSTSRRRCRGSPIYTSVRRPSPSASARPSASTM